MRYGKKLKLVLILLSPLVAIGIVSLASKNTQQTEETRFSAGTTLSFTRIARFDDSTNTPRDSVFLSNTGFMAAGNGNLYVWDRAESNVKVLTHDLQAIRTVGRRGQGPEEFSNRVRQLVPFREGVVAVDAGNQRVALLDGRGRVERTFPLPNPMTNSSFSVLALDEESGHAYILCSPQPGVDDLVRVAYLDSRDSSQSRVLPGAIAFRGNFDPAAGDLRDSVALFLVNSDTLLLVETGYRGVPEMDLTCARYDLARLTVSKRFSIVPSNLTELLAEDHQRIQRQVEERRRSLPAVRGMDQLSGAVPAMYPVLGTILQSEAYLVYALSVGGELHAIELDLRTLETHDLGTLPFQSVRYLANRSGMLFLGGASVDGVFIERYDVSIAK